MIHLSMLGPSNHNVEIFLLLTLALSSLVSPGHQDQDQHATNQHIHLFSIAFRAFTLFQYHRATYWHHSIGRYVSEKIPLQPTSFVKDLFFSTHTAAVFLLYFWVQKSWVKNVLLAGGLLFGFCWWNNTSTIPFDDRLLSSHGFHSRGLLWSKILLRKKLSRWKCLEITND